MIISNAYKAYMYSYPHKTAYGKLDNLNLFDYLDPADGLDIYVHIPFCKSKCGYCNLFSIAGCAESEIDRYLDAIEMQIGQTNLNSANIRNITIGGGTPMALSVKQLDRLFRMIPNAKSASVCIETSPNETTADKLEILKSFRVSRVSIGIQSFLDDELAVLYRTHFSYSAHRALTFLRDYCFPTVNVDLIYGIPGQNEESLEISLDQALSYAPEEIFLYPLYIRAGTRLFGACPNPKAYELYGYGRDFLLNRGYVQISMRRFAKRQQLPLIENSALQESLSTRSVPQNTLDCGFERVLSLGCGGRSYLGDLHFCRPYAVGEPQCSRIISDYINTPDHTKISHGIILTLDEHKRRYVIKNILHTRGLFRSSYRETFDSCVLDDFMLLYDLEKWGYATLAEDRIRLTQLGLSFSDAIGPMLISPNILSRTGGRSGFQPSVT